jgi:carboxyl-terminal processing protease
MKRFRFLPVLVIPLLLSGAQQSSRSDDDLFELRENFEIFGRLYEEIILRYVEPVRPQPLMRTGIRAMLEELDPYTEFYDQADNVDMVRIRTGGVADVGLQIGLRNDILTVLAPDDRADAYRQGIRTGDRILRIDSTEVTGMSVGEARQLLSGDNETTVGVTISRTGSVRELTFTLRRTTRVLQNVMWSGYLGSDSIAAVGYVRLNQFGPSAAREVRRSLRTMSRSGNGLKSIILDLRDNPGGILGEAVDLAGLFLPKGTVVVSTRGRSADSIREYTTDRDPLYPDLPVAVLINRFSASASEIVAGALQDLDRAVILGERSFGKGLVQIVRPLPHNTSMKITIAHYYTPGGRDIQARRIASSDLNPVVSSSRTRAGRSVRSGVGIEPDIRSDGHELTELESSLLRQGVFFRFADMFAAELQPVPDAGLPPEMPPDDTVLDRFMKWISVNNVEYTTESEMLMDSLSNALTRSGYDRAVKELEPLRLSVMREKEEDFNRHADNLLTRIRHDVMSRFLSSTDLLKETLRTDTGVEDARRILDDQNAYRRILSSR